MSKHRSKHYDECCCTGYGYGMGGYGMGGYGGFGGGYGVGAGCGAGYAGWGIRWIYALLILIVIVLQFGRRDTPLVASTGCEDGVVVPATTKDGFFNGEFIDRSVLFIIVVFLLILCAGCWVGGAANYGSQGYFGGYGY